MYVADIPTSYGIFKGVDDYWNPGDMIMTSCEETIDGNIAPCWLQQEGCDRPYGLRFKIMKESETPVEVTAFYQRIRNCGVNDASCRSGVREVDDVMWDLFAPGRALDADGVAPNKGDLKWRY